MSWFKKFFAFLTARKTRDQQWGERFDNPPATLNNKLPLDPGKSDLR